MAVKLSDIEQKAKSMQCKSCTVANVDYGIDNVKINKSTKKNKKIDRRVSTIQSASYVFDKGRTDKRVSLNVAPLRTNSSDDNDKNNFADRVTYVLGQENLLNRPSIKGFLYGCLNKSCGLIFPYTPNISFTHNVNYETNDIIHSNIHSINYKNTPPPSISLNATFTADTRDNAVHMLSAIWFLRAVTKCDFGEHNSGNNVPGMPPPILYLNGYNQIMDNIPVVVETFSYTLPEDKDYVALGINLNGPEYKFAYQRTNENQKQSGDLMLNGIKTALSNITGDKTTILSNGNPNGEFYFNNWLPTELKISLTLKIVPNLLKYKKQFDLNLYKMGIYNLPDYAGQLKVVTGNGVIDLSCETIEDMAEFANKELKSYIQHINGPSNISENAELKKAYDKAFDESYNSNNFFDKSINLVAGYEYNEGTRRRNATRAGLKAIEKQNSPLVQAKMEATMNELNYIQNDLQKGLNDMITSKTYKFDKSGWTW